MTPKAAYDLAKKYGPSVETRIETCRLPGLAYLYAVCIDKGPSDITREGACRSALYAYLYAKDVDKCPRIDPYAAASMHPKISFKYNWWLFNNFIINKELE